MINSDNDKFGGLSSQIEPTILFVIELQEFHILSMKYGLDSQSDTAKLIGKFGRGDQLKHAKARGELC
jgi:hypothetical protein